MEVTAKTIEEAKDAALDQLGVDEGDAEFEVVEEPKGGLFGRLRSEARVRARVLPTAPRPKLDRRDRRRSGGRERGAAAADSGPSRPDRAPRPAAASTRAAPSRNRPQPADRPAGGPDVTTEMPTVDGGEVAEDFVRGLLDAFGSPYTLTRQEVAEDTQEVAVEGDNLGMLIGPGGHTLAAVQELARTVVQRHAPGHHGWVVVDVSGYRKLRRQSLERFTHEVAAQVIASGTARVLEAMPPADRKVIHDTANGIPGVSTTSEGEEPRRRVVVMPAADQG
ncbi:MAG: RNA-binding cell elongation regulator Jag/EloR [Acidimicrobiales bacterium]